jgi:hypothetical protein
MIIGLKNVQNSEYPTKLFAVRLITTSEQQTNFFFESSFIGFSISMKSKD